MNYPTKNRALRYILLGTTAMFLSTSASEEMDKKSAHAAHISSEYAGTVNSFTFSPNGAFIASAADTLVELRKTDQNKSIQKHDRALKADFGGILWITNKNGFNYPFQPTALAVTWSPNGKLYAAAFEHSKLQYDGALQHCDAMTDSTSENVVIWSTKNGNVFRFLPVTKARSLAYNPQDSSCLAVGTNNNNVEIWLPKKALRIYQLSGHTAPVTQVEWNNDGTMLVSKSSNKQVKIWDAINGALKRNFYNGICSIAIINKNNLLSGSDHGTVDIWNTETGTCIKTIAVSEEDDTITVNSVAATIDNIYIAAALSNNMVKVFDTTTYECVKTIPFKTTVGKVLWNPDDSTNQLAVAVSNTIKLFSLSATNTTDSVDTPSEQQQTIFEALQAYATIGESAEFLRYKNNSAYAADYDKAVAQWDDVMQERMKKLTASAKNHKEDAATLDTVTTHYKTLKRLFSRS